MKPGKYLVVGVGMLVAGCLTLQQHELERSVPAEELSFYLTDKPEPTRRLYARVLIEGERNAVLNHARAGLAALEIGALDAASSSFDEALNRIEAIYADNKKAASARSIWTKENIKDFKGEPYERTMAYYYRGIVYMLKGDFQNARASFKSGMLQDALAEDESYQADFALMAYLEGWASRCDGADSLADESFKEAQRLRPELTQPSDHDLLLLADLGTGPSKIQGGELKQRLEFQEGGFTREKKVRFEIGSNPHPHAVAGSKAEDIYWQATTRGGRQIDAILDNKAVWKEGTDTAGDVAIAAGGTALAMGAQRDDRDLAAAGALIMFAGVVAKVVSDAMRPEADVRTWDNLPGSVHVATARRGPGFDNVEALFHSDGGDLVSRSKIERIASHDRCTIGWVRANSALGVSDVAPGAVAGKASSTKK